MVVKLLGVVLALLTLTVTIPTAEAAKSGKGAKLTQPSKEKLVLMPMRLSEEDKSLLGAMETALVEGLQQKYEVFSGEQVAQKAREIFLKESRSTAKKECDETRCMQGIAEAFQAELIATANVTKQSAGYFLALSIQNIFDNKVVYSKSIPCRDCDAFQVVDKLKELSEVGMAVVPAVALPEPVKAEGNTNDPETALWHEVNTSSQIDDYEAYLTQYPNGKFAVLANSRIKKLKDAAISEGNRKERETWEAAQNENSEASYERYLKIYANGRYTGLAKERQEKVKAEQAARIEQAAKAELAAKAEQAAKEETELWKKAENSNNRQAVETYLNRYPSGKHVVEAHLKQEEYKHILPRGEIPFVVSEDVWHAIETSDAYRNFPKNKSAKINYQMSYETEHTGSKVRSLPKSSGKADHKVELIPLSDKCSMRVDSYTNIDSTSGEDYGGTSRIYRCGSFELGVMMSNGKPMLTVSSIDELSGSLFPMRIGSKELIRAHYENGISHKNIVRSTSCEVVNRMAAQELNSKLTGTAWKVHCQNSVNGEYGFTNQSDQYYLEDMGVDLFDIGARDESNHGYILPSPGMTTVGSTTNDETASRTTTNYQSYDWSIGE